MGERLGQHFLKNQEAIKKIVAATDPKAGETVIEIGPGEGALTLPLAAACKAAGSKLIAIERDEELARQLTLSNVTIVTGDVLVELPKIAAKLKNFKVVGNIPYYITGAILRTISELKNKPQKTVLMIQKEVAERICATSGDMNILAAATQFWSKPEIAFFLPPSDFNPPPKVHSAVIILNENSNAQVDPGSFYRSLHAIFKQPRKTLLNNLADSGIERVQAITILKKVGLTEKTRAQDLPMEIIERLAAAIPTTEKFQSQ